MSGNHRRRERRARKGADRATVVAFDERAPQAEQTQALTELQKSHMPAESDLIPMEQVRNFLAIAQQDLEMGKAMHSNIVPFPSSAAKAGQPGMQSVRNDEFMLNLQGEYWERPSGMAFESMRMVCDRVPVLSALILTRMRQVQRFCSVAEGGVDRPGFEIVHLDRDHQLTKSEKESIKLLQRFVSNCGWEFKPRVRKGLRRDSFSQFMGKAVRDTLSMDACPIELEWKRDKKLGIDGFYMVDGATVRLCTDKGYRGDPDIHYLQVVEGRISTSYSFDDMIYEPRNPRSDVLSCGYGHSEVELMVSVVTGFLNAMTYNIKGFDTNAIPKGMLHLVGDYDKNDINAFKRLWNAMVRGVNNAWTLPVMVSKDAESKATFEKFGVEFDEMYFSKWMTFLTSIICAIYGMSPAEINFDSFSGGNTSPLAGSDTEEKLTASKDSGLRPLLAYFQNMITDFIIGDFSDAFAFRWTGLDPEDAEKKHERAKLTLTVDEMRAEDGRQAHPDPKIGAAPVNQALMAVYMQGIAPQEEVPPGDEDEEPASGGSAAPAEGEELDFGKAFGLPVLTIRDLMQ